MIKRIFTLFLACCILFSFLIFTASAEEFDNTTGWLNLFDYSPSINRNFATSAGATKQYVFDLPARMRLYDIDIVMFATNGAPDVSVLKANGQTVLLNKVSLGSNMFRYYGYIYYSNYDNVTLLIGDSVSHSGSIISAKVCNIVSTSYNTVGTMRFQSLNPSKPIDQKVTMASSSKSAHIAVSGLDFNSYILELSCADWYKYDTLDFVVSLDGVSVDSISADHNGKGVDVEYELADTLYDSYLYLVLRLDLTGLPRDSTIIPKITITGQTEDAVGLSLVKVKGCLYYDVPNPYLYWLYEIHNLLTDQSLEINEILTDMSTDLSGKLTTINSTLVSMNSGLYSKLTTLNSTISSMNTNLAGKLSTINTSITSMNTNLAGKLSTINTSITSMNSDLGSKLSTINTTLTTKFDSTISTVKAQFSNLKSWLSSGFQSVTDKLDILINGTVDQQESADDYKDDSAEKSDQIDNAINNMNVAKPPSNDINTSVEDISGDLNFGVFNSTLLVLTGQGYVSHILFIAVTLMLCAYVFFGKRG